MPEISDKEKQQANVKNSEMGSQKVSGLGALLREEREKKGLSHEQVSEMTRLRRHILEALESEEWHNLPPPVFVKGFIRSYASALGLDKERLLELYVSAVPVVTESPKPIAKPKKRKRGLIFIPILLLGVIAIIVYLWNEPPSPEQASIQARPEPEPAQTKPEPAPVQIKPEPAPAQIISEPARAQPEPVPAQIKPEPVPTRIKLEPAPARIKKESPPETRAGPGQEAQSPAPGGVEPDAGVAEVNRSEPTPAGEKPDEPPVNEDPLTASATEPPAAAESLVLKGIVKARTWIRIHIDDQEPREYIFLPGAKPQWKAREGFYILIGNAAGIDFEFNGKKKKNLGNLGQVVSLKLPENFEITIAED
jgi:cytoskeleton protein RodZ